MNSRWLAAICATATAAMPPATANPVLQGADPHAMEINGTYWLYPTRSNGPGSRFFAYSSPDLRQWKEHGPVLDFKDLAWALADGRPQALAWAPCIIGHGGRFYFYFSVGPQSAAFPAHIGVAVGDSPAGPFVDSGQPLLTGGNGFEAIDPFVFHDAKNGRHLLFSGGSAGATLRIHQLDESLTRLARRIQTATPPHFTEAPFLHQRDGIFHLTYSYGGWRDASYSVHHATAETPTGPWRYRGCILKSDARHKGPGHHSILRLPGTDQWRIIYHRWNDRQGDGPFSGSREIAIDRLEHTPDGGITPIRMTDGETSRPQ